MQNTRTKAMKNFAVARAEIFTWLRLILSSTLNILFLWDLSMTMTMGCGRSKSRSRSRRINFCGAGKVKMTVSGNFALFEKNPEEIGTVNEAKKII